MNKLAKKKIIALLAPLAVMLTALVAVAAPASAQADPIPVGADITLRNTLEDPGEPETPYAALFGQPAELFDENGVVSASGIEFPTALAQSGTPVGDISGLYEIEMTGNNISFTMLPAADDPFWSRVFGEFPEGKFDRYYFTFSEPHNVGSFTSSNESVSLRVDSPTVLVVEIGEGYAMAPPLAFSIDVQAAPASELAVTGAETGVIAVAGLAMLAAGSLMVSRARRLD